MTFKTLLQGAKRDLREIFTLRRLLFILLGTAICSFGIYNVHDQSGITEGGALGLILLLNHWFGIPSSLATPIIDNRMLCPRIQGAGKKIPGDIRHIDAEHGNVLQDMGELPARASQPCG